MKIKLLAVPSIIALIIILSIWVIYPAYSNGATGMKDNYKKFNIEKANLENIQGKSGKTGNLYSQIEAMPEDKDVLYSFVPESIKESEIIDNLNKMASDAGLLILAIDIKQPVTEMVAEAAPVSLSNSMDPSIDDVMVSADGQMAGNALPKAKPFETSIDAIGTYDQIKGFLSKVHGFSRYSSVSGLSIGKQIEPTDESADVLKASIKLEFDIIKKATISGGNVNDAIFSSDNIDTQVIAKIKNQYTNKALMLEAGQKGKGNIFMP